jgi:hypothetical protein
MRGCAQNARAHRRRSAIRPLSTRSGDLARGLVRRTAGKAGPEPARGATSHVRPGDAPKERAVRDNVSRGAPHKNDLDAMQQRDFIPLLPTKSGFGGITTVLDQAAAQAGGLI